MHSLWQRSMACYCATMAIGKGLEKLSCLQALVAGTLGIALADKHRLLAIAVLLFLASVVGKPREAGEARGGGVAGLLAIGMLAGIVKAFVGGGLTPLLYIAY